MASWSLHPVRVAMNLDTLAYRIKYNFPAAFQVFYSITRGVAVVRHKRGRQAALACATIRGTISGRDSVIRPLESDDTGLVQTFLSGLPKEHLRYFQPHGMDHNAISGVLSSRAYCCYGVFVEEQIKAYCLIKLFPTRNAYIGRLVAPDCAGQGIGKFLSRYLCWQSSIIQVTPSSTIHRNNFPSLASHRAVRETAITDELPNGFVRVVYPKTESDSHPPELHL